MDIKNLKTHMGWAIVVLLALLFGSLSVEWSTLAEIPNIISIALGLSSLALALVAIVQSVSSGNALTLSLGKIESAAERALRATESVDASASALEAQTSMFEQIPPSLAAIRERIESLSELNSVETIPNNAPSDDRLSKYDVESLYRNGSVGTNIAAYFAVKSFETSKDFNPISAIGDQRYIAGIVHGYLIALRSAGIIEMEYVNGQMLVKNAGPFSLDTASTVLVDNIKGGPLADMKLRIDTFFEGNDEHAERT